MSDFLLFDPSLGLGTQALLVVSLAIALGFEFVNGFHDTANAVATVIYTKSLGPRKAVVWSGLCNFLGVYLGGTAVAFGIVSLLPVDLLVSVDSSKGLAMVMALLVAAIVWNFGTWYLGLPASSSHTLIGAILGVGVANSLVSGRGFSAGVNWPKAIEVGLSLLISPLVGFLLAALLLLLLKRFVNTPALYQPPEGDKPPPPWIRGILLTTCTGVSLAHGSNDGQKGIGLVMLILIGVIPAHYALDPRRDPAEVARITASATEAEVLLRDHLPAAELTKRLAEIAEVRDQLAGKASLAEVPTGERWGVRANLIEVDKSLELIEKHQAHKLPPAELKRLQQARSGLRSPIYYAPTWVLVAVASALGLGTTVGWKRIVVTVGEKIGKAHLSYAQGASAELVAMTTIGLADLGGLPVSTTHVLSSGVAGTMAANGTGLQWSTVRNILLAWVLTLPVSMLLSAGLFVLFRALAT
jgi:PiT family inorganic phosphate transporter